jgi:membrane protease YdiL (CAAX protease family)
MNALPTTFWPLAATWLLAVLSLWCPPFGRVPAWAPCLALAIVVAVALGAILPVGVGALAVLAGLCVLWRRAPGRVVKGLALAAIIVLSLALALHAVPGFVNPLLLDKVTIGAGAKPVSLYFNLDKTAVGILLCATFAAPARTAAQWRGVGHAYPIIVLTPVFVLAAGWALGVVGPDPKWVDAAPLFLALNLCTTCLAEEAFFRASIQGRLNEALASRRHGSAIAIGVAAVLFGIAHGYGGAPLVVLATLAGIGYGLAYRRGGIEAAILTHFALNAAHFLLFTYPALR